MSKGLPKADTDRIYHEAVYVLGPDRGLVGSRHWLDSNVVELEEPKELLALGEHYAMIRRLNAIKGVEEVYLDNGARARPGGSAAPVRVRGGVRDRLRNFLVSWGLDDV
jgi:hypothetical protein